MKSILMSIKPKWVEKIISGEKTIDVRKTAPKEVPFKVYIYCTKDKRGRIGKPYQNYGHIGIWGKDFCPPSFIAYGGKVIGEFVCDYVEKEAVAFTEMGNLGRLYHCRLSLAELKKYAGKRTSLYYWHISALKVYDKPKELGELYGYNKELEKRFIDGDDFCCHDATNEYGEAMTECDGENIHNCYRCWEEWSGWCHRITRPPQSWQYVHLSPKDLEDKI